MAWAWAWAIQEATLGLIRWFIPLLHRLPRLHPAEAARANLNCGALQQQAAAQARPFAAESLYDSHGLPG
jgi:hypothetical protein